MVSRSSLEDGSAESGPAAGENPAKQPSGDAKIHRRISMAEKLNASYEAGEKKGSKESNTDRLRYILEEPALRSLFRDFLRGNFCEENLSFWMDVQDFKRKFNISSSAMAAAPRQGTRSTPGHVAMERHHESLINTAFIIYNTYLAPSSQCELNIDHGLRNELAKYLDEVVTSLTGKAFQGRVEPAQANAFNATQLQNMIRLYERIQVHVFRLMSTDSVPKVSLNVAFQPFLSSPFILPSSLRRQSFRRCGTGKTSTQQKTMYSLCHQGLQRLQA
jgi:hypothetical protein